MGVEPGDVSAALVDNGNTLIECALATHEAGLQFTPLNTHLTAHELSTIMDHSGCKVLVAGARFAPLFAGLDRVDSSGCACSTVGEVDGFESLAPARAARCRASAPADRRPGSLFVYTSGTTGRPKGIRRPIPPGDPDLLANADAVFGRAFDFRPFDGPMLVSTGMFHGGSHSYYMGGLNVGHALVIMDRSNPSAPCSSSSSTASAPPTWCRRSSTGCCSCRPRSARGTTTRACTRSSTPLRRARAEVKAQMMEWWGPVIWETYGGMEGAATIAKPHRWLEKPGHRRPVDPRRPAEDPRRRRQRGAGGHRRPGLHGERRRVQLPRRP